jgi:membrane protein implicated in regulation of membrane protease activity
MSLEGIAFWYWWIAGIAFVVIEIFAPGFVFLWLGVAAGIVGLLLLAVPSMSWELQFLIFAVLSVAAVAGSRLYLRRHPTVSDHPTLNRRGEQYVSRVFTLKEAIVNGQGKIQVDDSTWKIEGEDLPAGAKVRVVGVESTRLLVEKA